MMYVQSVTVAESGTFSHVLMFSEVTRSFEANLGLIFSTHPCDVETRSLHINRIDFAAR